MAHIQYVLSENINKHVSIKIVVSFYTVLLLYVQPVSRSSCRDHEAFATIREYLAVTSQQCEVRQPTEFLAQKSKHSFETRKILLLSLFLAEPTNWYVLCCFSFVLFVLFLSFLLMMFINWNDSVAESEKD